MPGTGNTYHIAILSIRKGHDPQAIMTRFGTDFGNRFAENGIPLDVSFIIFYLKNVFVSNGLLNPNCISKCIELHEQTFTNIHKHARY